MKHVGTIVPGLITFDTIQEAEDVIRKTYSDKEWRAQYGAEFEMRVGSYLTNPPQYYVEMVRVRSNKWHKFYPPIRRRNE